MSEDGQRGPGSGGTAHRERPGAGQARQDAGGESLPGDGQDHVGTPRPDAAVWWVVVEPPIGIEPMTYALRVRRSDRLS